MDPLFAKAAVLLATVALVAIRAPHGHRSRTVKVVSSRKGKLEVALLTLAWLGFFVPLFWVFAPRFPVADYPLHPIPFAAGVACYATGLWLFFRSHRDLGTNWSITLEVRESHRLVTHGVYREIRHPMYSALTLFSLGQALVLPNWLAGPSYLVSFGLLLLLRLGPEERMMREAFGPEYDAYVSRTKRIIPHVW